MNTSDKINQTFKAIRKGDITVTIEVLPGFAKPCLCVRKGTEVVKYASFTNYAQAEHFANILSYMILGKEN